MENALTSPAKEGSQQKNESVWAAGLPPKFQERLLCREKSACGNWEGTQKLESVILGGEKAPAATGRGHKSLKVSFWWGKSACGYWEGTQKLESVLFGGEKAPAATLRGHKSLDYHAG